MKDGRKVGFIGAGNMASALAKGMLAAGLIAAEQLFAADVDEERRRSFERGTSATVLSANRDVVHQCDVVVLAVKPQQMQAVLEEAGPEFAERHLVISIAAGITTAYIEKFLRNGVRLVRAMPNTPMLVGAGAVGISKGKWATDADISLARSLFEAAAVVVNVEEEQLDAVTAVSGSGPAYFFYLAEMMIEAGIDLGLSEETATALARQTAHGAGKMLAERDEHPRRLREMVTSPGGTTQAAIEAMDRAEVRESVIEAIKAAAARSVELGKQV